LKLGLELTTSRPTALRLGTFFETWITTASGNVRRSLGRDEYHLSLGLGEGRRLCATGRTHLCQLDLAEAGLGPNQARPAAPADLDLEIGTPVLWAIRTNQFLTLPDLVAGSRGRLVREGSEPLDFPLDHPLLTNAEVAPGRYVLDISALLLP